MTAERLGISLESGDLKWSGHQVRDIDFVAAAGMTKPELGILLIRAYVGNDAGAVKLATWLATKQSRRYLPNIPEGMRRKLAGAAVREFLLPICNPCGGTGKALQGQKWIVCPTCAGTTIKRYTDGERARMIGVDTLGQWGEPYSRILGRIYDAYYAALVRVGRRMGSGAARKPQNIT